MGVSCVSQFINTTPTLSVNIHILTHRMIAKQPIIGYLAIILCVSMICGHSGPSQFNSCFSSPFVSARMHFHQHQYNTKVYRLDFWTAELMVLTTILHQTCD